MHTDNKYAFLTLIFFSSNFRLFHVRSFNNHSNIFKNAFYVFVRKNGIVLDNSVRSHERTIVPMERRPVL